MVLHCRECLPAVVHSKCELNHMLQQFRGDHDSVKQRKGLEETQCIPIASPDCVPHVLPHEGLE